MTKKISLKEGKAMIKFCREIIKSHFTEEEVKAPKLKILEEKRGVFVTLKSYPKKNLRGCIGFIEGIMPLKRALIDVALSSAFKDPRFPPVKQGEINLLLIELSILSPPTLLSVDHPKNYLEKVVIGEDGLIVERDFRKGLLLPQVAKERKWSPREFLSNTCLKAGLTPDAWLDEETKIYKFKAEVFTEEEPEGKVVREEL